MGISNISYSEKFQKVTISYLEEGKNKIAVFDLTDKNVKGLFTNILKEMGKLELNKEILALNIVKNDTN